MSYLRTSALVHATFLGTFVVLKMSGVLAGLEWRALVAYAICAAVTTLVLDGVDRWMKRRAGR